MTAGFVALLGTGSVVFAAFAAFTADRRRSWLSVGLCALCGIGGILGTVTGLVGAFGAVADADPAEKASLLSARISEAMLATEIGWAAAFVTLALALVGLWRAGPATPPPET